MCGRVRLTRDCRTPSAWLWYFWASGGRGLQWLCFFFVAHVRCRDHYLQFGHLAGLPHFSHSFLHIIWLACAWTIWKERNNHIFNQNATSINNIADMVKLLSFHWLKANLHSFALSYHDWWQHSISWMSIFMQSSCCFCLNSWCSLLWYRWTDIVSLLSASLLHVLCEMNHLWYSNLILACSTIRKDQTSWRSENFKISSLFYFLFFHFKRHVTMTSNRLLFIISNLNGKF